MREIKFRGKPASTFTNATWIYGYFSESAQGTPFICEKGKALPWEVIPETVGQFTGLLDRDGREIYEGDIVFANKHWPRALIANYYGLQFVLERDGGFCADFARVDWERFSVIGNIHENPDLLKAGKKDGR